MAGRQWHKRSAAEKAQMLAAWRASRLTATQFAAQHDVGVESLYRWQREARQAPSPRPRRRAGGPAPAVLPVHVRPGEPALTVEVVLRNGRRLRCAAAVSPTHVAALAAALEAAAC